MSKQTVKIDGKPVPVGTAEAFKKLAAAFEKATGETLHVRSGLRTRAEQQRLWDLYKAGKGNLAARPGTSRHEKGNALDVYDSGRDAGVTRANNKRSNWLKNNAHKYGFKANGYGFKQVEPWHIEYTGDPWKTTVKPTVENTPKTRYEVTATSLNGRSGPGTQYAIKTKRPRGFRFNSTKRSGNWVRAGKYWYHTHYLKVVASKPQAAVHMRLGTLNIPLDADKLPDGEKRAKLAAEQINASNLDVLALQELSRGTGYEHKYATMLLTELGAGWGIIRPTTGLNENYIFYRASRARLVDQPADVILTPLAGHRGHATGVKLNVGGKDFVFMSTHLVNGKQAGASREAQGEQLANISNATTIIMGDLNQSTVPKALARTHKTVREHIITPMTRWGTYAKWGKDEVTIKADTILDHVLVPDSATIRGYTLVGVDQNAGTLSMPRASDHVLVVVSVVI